MRLILHVGFCNPERDFAFNDAEQTFYANVKDFTPDTTIP